MRQLITILIPVNNEEQNIAPLLERISKAVLPLSSFRFEVLFVDDGSTDLTIKKIGECTLLPTGYIQLSRNFGHQAALEAGLQHACGDAVISMDGDLQHPPEIIPDMLAAYAQGADIVQMKRTNTGSDLKGILSVLFYSFFNWVSDAPVVPNAADFRLMSKRAVEEIKRMHGNRKLLRALIPAIGFKQVYLPYHQDERKAGKPKYTFFSSYELAIHTIFKFSTFPVHLLLFTGITVFLSAIVMLICSATGIISLSMIAVHVWLACVISGLVLFCAGILSWYLYFILEQVRRDALFIVSRIESPKHPDQE